MPRQRTFSPVPRSLYFTDNGRVVCTDHLGASARTTGRDISGQRIARVTNRDADAWRQSLGEDIECEDCHASYASLTAIA